MEQRTDDVVFGEPSDMVLLGSRSLEGLNLRVDPTSKRLVDAGPAPAAAIEATHGSMCGCLLGWAIDAVRQVSGDVAHSTFGMRKETNDVVCLVGRPASILR